MSAEVGVGVKRRGKKSNLVKALLPDTPLSTNENEPPSNLLLAESQQVDGQVQLPDFWQELKTAIVRAMEDDRLDLTQVEEELLIQDDTARRARIALVTAYLRQNEFLLKKPKDDYERYKQVDLAHSYIRHAESRNLEALRMFSRPTDDSLLKKLNQAREEALRISELKSKRANPEVIDIGPQR